MLIQSIPIEFWAALLGSFLTIVGVILNNRHHRAIQQAQLQHDAQESDRQRKFDTRSTVYLAAAGEMVKAHHVLGSLSKIDFSDVKGGELLSNFTVSTTKATLIGSDSVTEAINEYLSTFVTAFFYLLPKVVPIQEAMRDRDIQDELYKRYTSEIDRILATMTHINETHSHDSVDWNALTRNLEFNQSQADKAVELRSEAWDKINSLTMDFTDEVMAQARLIAHASLPALIALREDLEISTNIEQYKMQLVSRLDLIDRLIGQLKESLQ